MSVDCCYILKHHFGKTQTKIWIKSGFVNLIPTLSDHSDFDLRALDNTSVVVGDGGTTVDSTTLFLADIFLPVWAIIDDHINCNDWIFDVVRFQFRLYIMW